MSIIEEASPKQVRMAHLATVGSHSINGVAQLHTDLVKRDLFADFHELLAGAVQQQDQRRHAAPLDALLQPAPHPPHHARASAPTGSIEISRELSAARPPDRPTGPSSRRWPPSSGPTSATWRSSCSGARASSCRPRRCSWSRSSASTNTSASCWPASRSSPTTSSSSATPTPTSCRASTSSRARRPPATPWPSCTSS